MTRRGLRLSQLPQICTVKPKAAKTSAHQMAEDTLRELIAARFAVGKPVIHIDANWNDALLLRVMKEAIRQAKGQPFVVIPPKGQEND
ncbi:hypothetical protein M988_4334 [Hafnia paralvei ATCC 29927]|jgi:hypothetical protein|uniref:hypothetical protein n=1 Tax=Hafnia paralvei TaxID=546367 RepID=UPI0007E499EE|nr:hypothetical protein [Hafnia paralvei]OAT36009.1 hypothetical protein M988_4334 [Hafnia paralvei ATCC 29927]